MARDIPLHLSRGTYISHRITTFRNLFEKTGTHTILTYVYDASIYVVTACSPPIIHYFTILGFSKELGRLYEYPFWSKRYPGLGAYLFRTGNLEFGIDTIFGANIFRSALRYLISSSESC